MIFALYRVWRRLPARQRRRMLIAAGRHGPRVASTLLRMRRARV